MKRHDLHTEFPEFKEKIHDLKVSDTHFRRIFDKYDEVDQHIARIETGAEPTVDDVLNDLRLKRVVLKDELYSLLTK